MIDSSLVTSLLIGLSVPNQIVELQNDNHQVWSLILAGRAVSGMFMAPGGDASINQEPNHWFTPTRGQGGCEFDWRGMKV